MVIWKISGGGGAEIVGNILWIISYLTPLVCLIIIAYVVHEQVMDRYNELLIECNKQKTTTK